jgi:hypothetical protein
MPSPDSNSSNILCRLLSTRTTSTWSHSESPTPFWRLSVRRLPQSHINSARSSQVQVEEAVPSLSSLMVRIMQSGINFHSPTLIQISLPNLLKLSAPTSPPQASRHTRPPLEAAVWASSRPGTRSSRSRRRPIHRVWISRSAAGLGKMVG